MEQMQQLYYNIVAYMRTHLFLFICELFHFLFFFLFARNYDHSAEREREQFHLINYNSNNVSFYFCYQKVMFNEDQAITFV